MRRFRTITSIAIGVAGGLALFAPARAQESQCQIIGTWAGWGQNATGSFDIGSGQSCTIGATTLGHFEGSKVAKRPRHGTVKQLSLSNWQYTSKARYKGTDSFVLSGTGHEPWQPPGQHSSVTLNVNVR